MFTHSANTADHYQQEEPLLGNILARIDVLHELGNNEPIKTYWLCCVGIVFV